MIRITTNHEPLSQIEVDVSPDEASFARDEHGSFIVKKAGKAVAYVGGEFFVAMQVIEDGD